MSTSRPLLPRPIAAAAVRSQINVTPLVDVCLVLLIIFMVVTPMLSTHDAVLLPQTLQPRPVPEHRRQLTLVIEPDGAVFMGASRAPVALDLLPAALRDSLAEAPDRPVVIKADKRLKYRAVRDLMRMLMEAGCPRAGLAVERRPGQPG
jgi:biopolymer transport protein ExbD